jgi:hypothetical protein
MSAPFLLLESNRDIPESGQIPKDQPPQIFARDSEKRGAPEAVAVGARGEFREPAPAQAGPQPLHRLVVPDFSQWFFFRVSQDVGAEKILGTGGNVAVPQDQQGVPRERARGIRRRSSPGLHMPRPVVRFFDHKLVEAQSPEIADQGFFLDRKSVV